MGGASVLRIDAPKYTYFDDRRLYPDPERLVEQLAEHVRAHEGVEGVTTSMHICRGAYRGMYCSSVPYEEFAGTLFARPATTGCCASATTRAPGASSRCASSATA